MNIPTAHIVWIINGLHVGTSNVDVVRNLRHRMDGKPAWTKPLRKAAYRYALEQHKGNRRFYAAVQSGRVSVAGEG